MWTSVRTRRLSPSYALSLGVKADILRPLMYKSIFVDATLAQWLRRTRCSYLRDKARLHCRQSCCFCWTVRKVRAPWCHLWSNVCSCVFAVVGLLVEERIIHESLMTMSANGSSGGHLRCADEVRTSPAYLCMVASWDFGNKNSNFTFIWFFDSGLCNLLPSRRRRLHYHIKRRWSCWKCKKINAYLFLCRWQHTRGHKSLVLTKWNWTTTQD